MARKRGRQGEDPWLGFLSHSSVDAWVIQQIKIQVEAQGARTFLDEAHVAVGEDFGDRIFGVLGRADELFVLLTPWALKRPWIAAEIGAARMRGIPIIGAL